MCSMTEEPMERPPRAGCRLDRYRQIIWDWNGTLLDDQWLALDVANAMLRRRGLPTMDRHRYREIFDFPVMTYYERAGFVFDRRDFHMIAHEFIEEFHRRIGECPLHNGVRDILDFLNRRGVRQLILSASREEDLIAAVAWHGIGDYFQGIYGLTDHLAHSKAELARSVAATFRDDRDTVVMVGDTVHDYEVAMEMGIDCILVADGHQSLDRLKATGAKVVSDLLSLADSP